MAEITPAAQPVEICRASAALKNMFVADALAMPAHWFYNLMDIQKAFPGGITSMQAAPEVHPSSIMSLHSVAHGGRKGSPPAEKTRQVVGDVILKGKAHLWGQKNIHYHHGMKAGENTLNAFCARILIRSMTRSGGRYDKDRFLDDYIAFMTADPPRHPDTYAESYHRGFFANYILGKPKDRCGAVTHDTPSVGGLVTIAPIVMAERLGGTPLDHVQSICKEHLLLTHPDDGLARICHHYVSLIDALLWRARSAAPRQILLAAAQKSPGLNLERLVSKTRNDFEVVGGRFSSACYISESWPSLLYLACKYLERPRQALIVNTNLGGDNVHRGAVMGIILGLASGQTVADLFDQLVCRQEIASEIEGLLSAARH